MTHKSRNDQRDNPRTLNPDRDPMMRWRKRHAPGSGGDPQIPERPEHDGYREVGSTKERQRRV